MRHCCGRRAVQAQATRGTATTEHTQGVQNARVQERTGRAHPRHALQGHDLLLQQVVEQHYLVFQLQACVVRLQSVRVLPNSDYSAEKEARREAYGHFRHTSGEHSHLDAQWQGSRGMACLEEFSILFLELQPHQLGELWRHVLMLFQRLCDLLLAHVLAQVSLY